MIKYAHWSVDAKGTGVGAYQANDAAVLIVVGIKEQELQFAIGSACWRWYLLYDGRQYSVQSMACNVTAVMHHIQHRTAGTAHNEVGTRCRNHASILLDAAFACLPNHAKARMDLRMQLYTSWPGVWDKFTGSVAYLS